MTAHYHYNKFPPKDIDFLRLMPLIGPANAALGKFDGTLAVIQNPNVLLAPLTVQEAVESSKIEGTITTIGEVLQFKADANVKDIPQERQADLYEVINYREALELSIEHLQKLPLSQRIIKGAHAVLLEGVRGQGKSPGKYRQVPNWIGPPGCTIENARYVPVSAEQLPDRMGKWEKFIHEDYSDKLIQLASLHAEFEALHPFLDGNGRLGRMLVPLFMVEKGILSAPVFYISAYFEKNRDKYYERLLAVSRDDDWTGWCEFFLKAVIEQARDNQQKADGILKLYDTKKQEIVDITRSPYALNILDYIFSNPVFTSTEFTKMKYASDAAAKRNLRVLRDNELLVTLREAKGSRPAIYCFAELLNVAADGKLF